MTERSNSEELAVRSPEEVEVWDPYYDVEPTPKVIDAWAIDTPILPRRAEISVWAREVRGGARLRGRKVAAHGVRSPLYFLRATRYSMLGLYRALSWFQGWLRDVEKLQLARDVAVDPSLTADVRVKRHADAHEARVHRVWFRISVTAVLLITALVTGAWLLAAHPWVLLLLAGVGLLALGLLGAQRGQIAPPVMPSAVILTEGLIVDAFMRAGVTKAEPMTVAVFPREVTNGTYVELDAPRGMKFSKILAETEGIASGLGIPEDCLELDPLPKKAVTRFGLFVANAHPADLPVPEWPILGADRTNIFRPMPVGWDLRGRPVHIQIMWTHSLIGALPRLGKTTIMRLIAIYTLLDPRADLIVVDFGGGADYRAFKPYCLQFICGEGAEQVAEFLTLLLWLRQEYQRRQARLGEIAEIDISRAPEGRLTEALAATRGLRPITVLVDEFQVATMAGKLGERIVEEWAELEKVCLKVGIQIEKATQTADDSVPTQLRNIIGQRMALTLASYNASIAMLGNNAYQMGLDASKLGGDPGYGMLFGSNTADGPGFKGRLKFANVTPGDLPAVMERVALIRRPAVVEATVIPEPDCELESAQASVPLVVAEALDVWPREQANCHLDVLAQRMGWDRTVLREALFRARIEVAASLRMTRPGEPTTTVRQGVRRADLEAVAR